MEVFAAFALIQHLFIPAKNGQHGDRFNPPCSHGSRKALRSRGDGKRGQDFFIGHDIQGVAKAIVDPESLSLTLLGNLKSRGFSTDMLREAVA